MGKISTNQFDQKQKFRELAIEMLVDIWEEYYKLKKYCKEKNSKFEEIFNVPKNEREILNSLVCTEIEEALIFLYFDYKNGKDIDYLKNSFDKKKDKAALESLEEIISCWKLSDEDKSKLKDLCDSQQKDKSESINSLINSWKVTKEEETRIADLLNKSEKKISKDRREKIYELLDVWKFIEKVKSLIGFFVEKKCLEIGFGLCLSTLENAFLYTISKLPWKDRDGNCHYPVGENKVSDKFLDKVADAINDGNADQLNGENFATVLLPNESIENSNIKYAIPQCIKGDITNAKLYHCLLNPGSGISDTKDNYDNFYDYLHDKDAMKDHLRIFDENGYATKEKLVEYMNDLKRNMLITEFEDFIAKYGNCTISENKVDEIFGNNGEKEFYYIMEYYKTLVAKGIVDFREIIKKNLSNLGTLSSNLNDVKLCNLELIPVRSQDGATVGNLIDENPFAVNIIIRRILISELKNEIEKPIFVFRSYDKVDKGVRWQDAFEGRFSGKTELHKYLRDNYFLVHSSDEKGAFSSNNTLTIKFSIKPNYFEKLLKGKNIKTEELIEEFKLALRAYKYIDGAQKAFSNITGAE